MIKVLLLAAVLNQHTPGAGLFAPYFREMGIKYGFDPLLVAAVASNESKFNPRAVSKTNDYGLMQIHVGKKFNKKYIGKEHLLFDPKHNIRVGTALMRMWQYIHRRRCKHNRHHWLNHYNQGTYVSRRAWLRGYADRVLLVYRSLKEIELTISRATHGTS